MDKLTDDEELSMAISVAAEAFENKFDKGGKPYILHCLEVMNGVKHLGPKAMSVAVLHDIIEDCDDWWEARLVETGFSFDVVNDVCELSRGEDEDYIEYIMNISKSSVLTAIKMADLRHNMDPSRLPSLSEKHLNRMTKYYTAYKLLLDRQKGM